ncbi:hypothetical protein [Burkholderia arboris]|nr:hypothetical protein [Burkholderia arboris]WDZ28078.1 hypothetical protein NLX30_39325 [Burkholderia arboris]
MTQFGEVTGRRLDLPGFLEANPWTIRPEKFVVEPEAAALA